MISRAEMREDDAPIRKDVVARRGVKLTNRSIGLRAGAAAKSLAKFPYDREVESRRERGFVP